LRRREKEGRKEREREDTDVIFLQRSAAAEKNETNEVSSEVGEGYISSKRTGL